MAIAVLRRHPGLFTAFIVSIVTSFLLGAINAGFAHSPNLSAFVGGGIAGTAASFILVAATRGRPAADSPTRALRLFRRVSTVLVLQALLCLTFVMVGYLTVEFAAMLFRKLPLGLGAQ